jgi:hypothetical protein
MRHKAPAITCLAIRIRSVVHPKEDERTTLTRSENEYRKLTQGNPENHSPSGEPHSCAHLSALLCRQFVRIAQMSIKHPIAKTTRTKREPIGTHKEKRIIVLMTGTHGAMTYLRHVPRKLPEGKVLVHNRVRPASPIGLNGFRIWLESLSDNPKLVVCDCGWAPHLETHYRVFGTRFEDKPAQLARRRIISALRHKAGQLN